MEAFAVAVLALAIANILMLILLVLRRMRLARDARRRDEVEERLRPRVLAFLEGDVLLPRLTPYEQEVVADMLGVYGRMLRGPSVARIAAYFERSGIVERELDVLAHDRKPWRRAAAAHRLGDVHARSSIPGLIGALDDDSREVRVASVRSLGRLGAADAVDPLLTAFARAQAPESLIGWALLQIGTPALPRLRAALDSPEAEYRASSLQLIGLLGDASDGDAVEARLRDSSAVVRAEAARALGRLGQPRHFAPLVEVLVDRVPAVRAAAATALGRLQARVVAPLLEVAQRDQFDVARAAAQAAAALDVEATAAAIASSPNPDHLREAVDLALIT